MGKFTHTQSLGYRGFAIRGALLLLSMALLASSALADGQRQQYVDSAQTSKDASKGQGAASIVWTGVTTVCTAACAAQFSPMIGVANSVCNQTNSAANVTDTVITQNYTAAVDNLVTTKTTQTAATSGAANLASSGDAAPRKDLSACATAWHSLAKAKANESDAAASMQSYNNNMNQAAALQSDAAQLAGTGEIALSAQTGTSRAATDAGRTIASVCSDTQTRTVGGLISCARAADPSIPAFVTTPQFNRELSKVSGKSPSDFYSQSDVHQALASGLAGTLNSEQQAKYESMVARYEKVALAQHGSQATYRSGGLAALNSKDPAEPDMGALMQGMIDKLTGAEGSKDPSPPRAGPLSYGGRDLASVSAEDPSVSIFDRVTHRYALVSQKFKFEPMEHHP